VKNSRRAFASEVTHLSSTSEENEHSHAKSREQPLELANDEECSTDHCCGTCDVCDAGIVTVNELVDKKLQMTGNCDEMIWNVIFGFVL
jgi:hypothetical protein